MRPRKHSILVAAVRVAALLGFAPTLHAGSLTMLAPHEPPFRIKQGWYAGADIPVPVNRAAAAEFDGTIYVIGGLNSNPVDVLQAYSPSANTWQSKARLPETLYEGDGAVVLRGKIYVPGGWNGSLPTDTLYVYDPATDNWSSRASMPHLSGCGMSGKIEGKLYVTTTCDGYSGYRRFLDVYDPGTDRWTRLSNSHKPHSQGAAAVIDDKLYVAGGQSDSGIGKFVEVYDPVVDKWTELAKMPTAVIGAAGLAFRGLFVVIGGTNNGNAEPVHIQAYDPVTGTWQKISPKLPSGRSFAAVADAYGRPFVIGGTTGGAQVASNLNLAIVTPIP